MKTKKNRKLKGGTPRILKITGYYDSDDIDKRQLIDFRVEKVNDIEAAEKYWEKHKVSIDPPKGLLEEVLDMFNFNQVYTNKALKRVDAFLSKSDQNRITETRYVIVNDKDDIDKIKITNQLIQRLASMKQQGKISGGGDGENELTEEDNSKINDLKKQLLEGVKEDAEKTIINSPGFTRILAKMVEITKPIPLDTNVLEVAPAVASDEAIPQDKMDKVLEIVTKLETAFNTLNKRVNEMGSSVKINNQSTDSIAVTDIKNEKYNKLFSDIIKKINQGTITVKQGIREFFKNTSLNISSETVNKVKNILSNASINVKNKIFGENIYNKRSDEVKNETKRMFDKNGITLNGGKKKTNKRRKKRNTKRV